MAESSKPSKRIMDVAHPNKSAPPTNSKSVIITRRPVMQDPMMVDDTSDSSSADVQPSTPKASKVTIQPLSAPLVPGTSDTPESPAVVNDEAVKSQTESATDSVPDTATDLPTEPAKHIKLVLKPLEPTAPADAESATEAAAEAKPNEVKTADPQPTVETNQPADKSAEGDEGAPNSDAAIDAELEAQKKADEALQKLVESKQYFVPINSLEKRRTIRVLVGGIVVSIVLILAWIDVALDAGLIHLGTVRAVTNFF